MPYVWLNPVLAFIAKMDHLSNLPAAITNSAPGILDFGRHWVLNHVQDQLGDFAWRQLVRGLGRSIPALREADPKELAVRIGRMEATLRGLSDELARLGVDGAPTPYEDEMREPAAQDFIADVFAASMESPNEQKRAALGRLVARRLSVVTESSDDLYLRQAFSILRRVNARQLNVLTVLLLIHQTPMPAGLNRAQLNTWLDSNLLHPLDMASLEPIETRDLEYLVTLGAVTYSERLGDEAYSAVPTHASSLEQNFIVRTREYLSPASDKDVFGEFYRRADALLSGKFEKETGIEKVALSPYGLTEAGFRIASIVLEQYLSQTA